MRKKIQNQKIFWSALLFGSLVVGVLGVVVAEAQKIPIFNRDVVLLDCVEDANSFLVENISSTRDVGIHQGQNCAIAVQNLFATGFVLGPGTGGVTSGDPTSLNHFLMLFVLNSNSLIEPRNSNPTLNPSGDCVFGQTFGDCPPNLERQDPLIPTLNSPEPLTPILRRRNP
jgi:hypothetical protein